MKNGKKPTYAQRAYIQSHNLKPENWLIVKDTPTEMVLVSRKDEIKGIRKEKILKKD